MARLTRPRSPGHAPAVDRGERIYAIGDLHGCTDLFRAMIGAIEDHAQSLPPIASTHVVLVGDLVDRGPDPAGLLSLVHGLSTRSDRLIVLKGNHEEMLLRALDGEPGAMRAWVRTGGETTLASYGIEPPRDADEYGLAARALAQAMPAQIVDWLRNLPVTAQSGDYLFVHAGIRPGVPIRKQTRQDLMWIRDEFLTDESDPGVTVVHGHTVVPDIEFHPYRIAIDTGAYRTGVLKALYLEGQEREVIVADGLLAEGETEIDAPRVRTY